MVNRVKKITSLTGSGMRDWLIQRMSAVLLATYTFFLLGYLFLHSPLQYEDWRGLFSHTGVQIFTVLTLLGVLYHTWIGMWTIFTDYIKCAYLRLILHVLTLGSLIACLIWGVFIVMGVN